MEAIAGRAFPADDIDDLLPHVIQDIALALDRNAFDDPQRIFECSFLLLTGHEPQLAHAPDYTVTVSLELLNVIPEFAIVRAGDDTGQGGALCNSQILGM